MPQVAEVRIDTCARHPSIVRVGWFDDVAPLFLVMADGVVWVLLTPLCLEQVTTCRDFFHCGPWRMCLLAARPDRLRLCLCGPNGRHVPLEYRLATEQERGQFEGAWYRMAAKEIGGCCCNGCVVG